MIRLRRRYLRGAANTETIHKIPNAFDRNFKSKYTVTMRAQTAHANHDATMLTLGPVLISLHWGPGELRYATEII